MSKRKPLNDTAGYVCSRKCQDGGYVMVIDRQNGGDWVAGDERWIVDKRNAELMNEGILGMPTKAGAIDLMKDTAAGIKTSWYEPVPDYMT